MNNEPIALQLADALLRNNQQSINIEAAAELRMQNNALINADDTRNRLIRRVTELEARIAELEAQLEAVGAGGVEPLRKRCLHQISEPAQAQPVDLEPVAAQSRFLTEKGWGTCTLEHHLYVKANPVEWPGYETRALYAAPQLAAPAQAAPASIITASVMRDDGGEHPAFCLMVAYRAEKDAKAALAMLTDEPAQAAAPDMTDAYAGAREDLSIWKKRALEAEALNRKFAASVNGPTFMGEPSAQAAPVDATVQQDAARYRFLRDGIWRRTDLEPVIRLQLNTLWDSKIDAAIDAQKGSND